MSSGKLDANPLHLKKNARFAAGIFGITGGDRGIQIIA
jgi:hypothetical protein